VVLGFVGQMLTGSLESVYFKINPEIEIEVVDVDQVGEVEFAAAGDSVHGGQHLAGDNLQRIVNVYLIQQASVLKLLPIASQ